ncbi:PAS domain S-box protein [Papillibacter cinnamivorans]|uniref:histidine kinase n=1 Tax=Papillibacter cinnamivorans DSM 12816 TaxID=1122930 RepID=A0A1W2BCD7_9FIRM|nr:PAS domain S-box protein [Papillibacter cinnamivorans]SMC70038.1 PAS domain S-box-containing protein [Papillibacter cinnamivorans DSM 12816]
MSGPILLGLANNAAIMMSLAVIYQISYLTRFRETQRGKLINGFLIGFIVTIVMSFPVNIAEGVLFDTRTIILSTAAFTFGAVPAAIASGIAIAYRIFIGGTGTAMGILIILSSFTIGILWRRYISHRISIPMFLNVYLLGITVHLSMLACILLLPRVLRFQVLKDFIFPVVLIFPLVTVFLTMLLLRQKEREEYLLQLEEAQARYKSLFYHNSSIILLIDPENGSILEANPAACRFYGWSEDKLKSMKISDIDPIPVKHLFEKYGDALPESQISFVSKHRRAAGEPADVEVFPGSIDLAGKKLLCVIMHDVSSRVAAEKRLLESESRFRQLVEGAPEAIYIRAGNRFAFLNPAAVSLFGAQSAEQLIGAQVFERYHPDYLPIIQKRIGLLSKDSKVMQPVELIFLRLDGSSVWVEVVSMILFDVQMEEGLPDIKCRSQQIQQVLMNLLTNSRDALNEKYPGCHKNKIMNLTCRRMEKDGKPWIRTVVEDHGVGIPKEIQGKIFEPFFSTKPKDIGTGLGLSISFGIIRDHQGVLRIDSREGRYTKMILDLPADNGWTLE